jgi:hypothetical protein
VVNITQNSRSLDVKVRSKVHLKSQLHEQHKVNCSRLLNVPLNLCKNQTFRKKIITITAFTFETSVVFFTTEYSSVPAAKKY